MTTHDPDETPPKGLRGEAVERLLRDKCLPDDKAVTGIICPNCAQEDGGVADGYLRTDNGHEVGLFLCGVCDGKGVVERGSPKLAEFLKAYVDS